MKNMHNINRQGGAVAVIVGISIVLLVGFLAMVIDLGHLYVAKTELQNAADAAALSGAKQLNNTLLGVNDTSTNNGAVQWAIATAAKNKYDFSSKPVDISIADIWVGSCPDDSCMVPASSITTDAAAAGKTFLKVHTRQRNLVAWFAPIWNIFMTSTYGVAVAGPLLQNIAPIGVCAVDVATSPTNPSLSRDCDGSAGVNGASTVKECGFLRGVAYNIININPMMHAAYPIWINPVDIPPGNCDPNHAATNYMRSFVCEGKAAVGTIPGNIYANTGGSATLDRQLNSRFDLNWNNSGCDPTTAPPDINVKQYAFGGGANQGRPKDWMEPGGNSIPTQQSVTVDSGTHLPLGYPTRPASFDQWGALWSYARERNWSTGSDYGLCDWGDNTTVPVGQPCYGVAGANLYGGLADQTGNGYPTTGTPYQATSGKYFQASSSYPGKRDRRVLNLLIIDCQAPGYPIPGPGASCAQLSALAVGRFFMPVEANLPSYVYGEFAGLLPATLLKKQYVLYK